MKGITFEEIVKNEISNPLNVDAETEVSEDNYPGTFASVEISKLRIDREGYQRTPNNKTVNTIAREFCWEAFGVVSVVCDENGVKWVIDGQQRITAAMLRGIKKVPCIISNGSRVKAASLFRKINETRNRISSVSQYRAGVTEGATQDLLIRDMIASVGMRIDENSSDPASISWVGMPHRS